MNGMNRKHMKNRPFAVYLRMPLFALLAFIAVMTGVKTGDLLYKLDFKIIERIDSENFKDTINLSFPMIETIYNSGKSSVSFTREIKNLFTDIFEFDLDSPVTILNVQSPIFMSYYNHEYKSMLALGEDAAQQQPVTPDTGNAGGTPDGGTDGGKENNGDNTGTDGGNPEGSGSNADNNNPNGENSDNSDKDNQAQTPGSADNGGQAGEPEGSGDKSGTASPSTGNDTDLQPISSITYEPENETEDDDTDMVALDKMVIKNYTKHKIDIAKLLKEPLNLDLSGKGPKVLVYHTHTSESYVLKEEDLGKKNVPSFNSNPQYSVVRVGEELARNLRKYGIETLHNGTVHDKVRDAAYGVAINTLKSYVKSYPSIKVYIDVHRDAVGSEQPKLRMVKKINGKNAAQIMFVMGTNDMLPYPGWEKNLKFALKIQQKLNEKYPGLARPLMLVGKRYNQHISDNAILIEVGGDGNLLSECLESTKYLAEALNEVMKGK